MSKAKKSKKAPAKESKRMQFIGLKAPQSDRREFQRKANIHEKGNMSAWLRRAGKEYTPKRAKAA